MSGWTRHRTERLWLGQATDADVDDLFAIHGDPAVWTHFPSGRHGTREESATMVEAGRRQWAEEGLGYWSIRDAADGPVIGRGGCARPAGCPWWNLYYRFSPSVQGLGYATEMARVAIEAAHDVRPGRAVLAYLLEHNETSRRTAEKVGLQLAWRGPDAGNPDPSAIRLVFTDREPDADLMAAIVEHC